MNDKINTLQTPVLVEDKILDGRSIKYGKTVIERYFKMPNGNIYPILCVSSSGMASVIVFPFTDHGTILLLNQFRFGTNKWMYEFPGGCQKTGQTWQDAVKGELLEEVGAEASTLELIGSPISLNPALEDTHVVVVLARECKIVTFQNLDVTEKADVIEVTVVEFKEMVRKGKIFDAKTITTGYLALDRLGLLW